MRFAVLTRANTRFGYELLRRLDAIGLHPDCIGIEKVTWRARWRMARLLARKTGFWNAVWHNTRIWSGLLLASLTWRKSSVDYAAFSRDLLFTTDMNGPEMESFMAAHSLDLLVLGQSGIVRENLLRLPRIGTLNAHPGRLPDFRGVDVVRWALMAHQPVFATLHFVDRGVDTGDTICSASVAVRTGDRIEDVERRAVERSLDLLAEAVARAAGRESFERTVQPPGIGRQYYLMPPWTQHRLRRHWPEIRDSLVGLSDA